MFKHLYTKFLESHKDQLHFACHSHHYWPDASLDGQIEAWTDAQKLSDKKWNKVTSEIVPKVQNQIANILNLKKPQNIAFAPNTHELFSRLLSCFLEQGSLTILSSSGEFYSFERQLNRLKEFAPITHHEVDSEKLVTNREEFFDDLYKKLNDNSYDIIFLSQVMFQFGSAITEDEILKITEFSKDAIIVIDGYHGFCARPTDLSNLEDKIYYMAGSYKYAQGGEGLCFMTIPDQCNLRPVHTGWFADFASLKTGVYDDINYSNDGFRFWGSTIDPTPFYRFKAVWEKFESEKITVSKVHELVQKNMQTFIDCLPDEINPVSSNLDSIGHFLTFEFSDNQDTEKVVKKLDEAGVLVDFRGNRLRFGFGMYHNKADIQQAATKFIDIIK